MYNCTYFYKICVLFVINFCTVLHQCYSSHSTPSCYIFSFPNLSYPIPFHPIPVPSHLSHLSPSHSIFPSMYLYFLHFISNFTCLSTLFSTNSWWVSLPTANHLLSDLTISLPHPLPLHLTILFLLSKLSLGFFYFCIHFRHFCILHLGKWWRDV